jgi:hypothetical protein
MDSPNDSFLPYLLTASLTVPSMTPSASSISFVNLPYDLHVGMERRRGYTTPAVY